MTCTRGEQGDPVPPVYRSPCSSSVQVTHRSLVCRSVYVHQGEAMTSHVMEWFWKDLIQGLHLTLPQHSDCLRPSPFPLSCTLTQHTHTCIQHTHAHNTHAHNTHAHNTHMHTTHSHNSHAQHTCTQHTLTQHTCTPQSTWPH